MLNQSRNVLWEKSNRNDTETYFGYTEDYLKVMIKSSEKLFNTITNVKLKEIKNDLIFVTQ